jgi:phospholipid-binding lipoprotein MlaA
MVLRLGSVVIGALVAGLALLEPAVGSAQTAQTASPEAARGDDAPMPNPDPFESTNRTFFLIGGALDIVLIRPAAVFYQHVTPRPAREGVHNVVVNLGEPVNFFNRVLQLRPERAVATFGRFALNSTVGVGGIFDVASGAGLPEQGTDFGQTLGRYGVASGPYLFIPVIGPSDVRDATGKVVDIFLDPLTYLRFRDDAYVYGTRTVLAGLDARVRADPALRAIQRTATDPYAAIRSAYLQNAQFLNEGEKVDVKSLPDFGPEPPPSPPSASQTPPSPPASPQ